MSRNWSQGSTRRWRRIRAGVLLGNVIDNGGRCRLAVRTVCSGRADQVHHVNGIAARDGVYAAACGACNRHVGDPAAHPAECRLCDQGKAARAPRPRPVTRW